MVWSTLALGTKQLLGISYHLFICTFHFIWHFGWVCMPLESPSTYNMYLFNLWIANHILIIIKISCSRLLLSLMVTLNSGAGILKSNSNCQWSAPPPKRKKTHYDMLNITNLTFINSLPMQEKYKAVVPFQTWFLLGFSWTLNNFQHVRHVSHHGLYLLQNCRWITTCRVPRCREICSRLLWRSGTFSKVIWQLLWLGSLPTQRVKLSTTTHGMRMVNKKDLDDLFTKLSACFAEQVTNLDAKFNEITKKYNDIAMEIRETRYQHDTCITKLEEKYNGLHSITKCWIYQKPARSGWPLSSKNF